jgi:hypothetical protein
MMSYMKFTARLELILARGFTSIHLVNLLTVMSRWVKPLSAFLKGPRRSGPHTANDQVMGIVWSSRARAWTYRTTQSASHRWRPLVSKNLVGKPSQPCSLMKHDVHRPPREHRGVVPCPPQGGCTAEGWLRCCGDTTHCCVLGTPWPDTRGTESQFCHLVLFQARGI